jgi:serine/threonine-protein kinase
MRSVFKDLRLMAATTMLVAALAVSGCGLIGSLAVKVPNIKGLSAGIARAKLEGAGLVVGSSSEESSETVAAGTVLSSNPAAGSGVKKGSAVALVLSKGPAPVAPTTSVAPPATTEREDAPGATPSHESEEPVVVTCPSCGGTGVVTYSATCSECGGTGVCYS